MTKLWGIFENDTKNKFFLGKIVFPKWKIINIHIRLYTYNVYLVKTIKAIPNQFIFVRVGGISWTFFARHPKYKWRSRINVYLLWGKFQSLYMRPLFWDLASVWDVTCAWWLDSLQSQTKRLIKVKKKCEFWGYILTFVLSNQGSTSCLCPGPVALFVSQIEVEIRMFSTNKTFCKH